MELPTKSLEVFLVSLVLLKGFTVTASSATITDVLYTDLFTNYTSSVIPICTSDGKVTLEMDLALRQVMNLNEREQILTTNVWVRLKWNDCRLTWTPSSYNNVTQFLVPFDDVWVPDITLYDSEMLLKDEQARSKIRFHKKWNLILASACLQFFTDNDRSIIPNNMNPEQTPNNSASDQVIYCLQTHIPFVSMEIDIYVGAIQKFEQTEFELTKFDCMYFIIFMKAVIASVLFTRRRSAADEVMFPGKEDYRASIYSTGMVTYNFPTVVTSVCRVNVKYFPFDTQRCSLKFGSWSHHGLELNIVSKNPSGDLSSYVKNNELTVDEFPVTRSEVYYACCTEPYPDVTFYIVLTRRPAFNLMTMVFPCILVSFVAATVFLLPVESGEKVSLEITVLLSLAVFLLVVSETLPPASDNFPIIGSYFVASMVLVSLSLVQTIVVLNVFYRGTNGRQVPRWAKVICFQYIGRIVCGKRVKIAAVNPEGKVVPLKFKLKEPSCNGIDPESNIREFDSEIDKEPGPENGRIPGLLPSLPIKDPLLRAVQEQTQSMHKIEKILHDKNVEEENNSDWRDLANIMDRAFLLFYVVVTVITTLSFLLQCIQ